MRIAGLTAQQQRAFYFIKTSLEETCVCPSYQEIAEHLGLKSKSGVHRLISALCERGYIERGCGKRSLILTQQGYDI